MRAKGYSDVEAADQILVQKVHHESQQNKPKDTPCPKSAAALLLLALATFARMARPALCRRRDGVDNDDERQGWQGVGRLSDKVGRRRRHINKDMQQPSNGKEAMGETHHIDAVFNLTIKKVNENRRGRELAIPR